jgi:acetyl esterase/lipase
MAPSKESEALGEWFKTFAANAPADGDPFITRCIYDTVHTVAAEAPGVTYESITAAGLPCLWISPQSASKQHVILFMHGGGFSFGSPTGHRKLAAHLAKACNCMSLSVEYRLVCIQWLRPRTSDIADIATDSRARLPSAVR